MAEDLERLGECLLDLRRVVPLEVQMLDGLSPPVAHGPVAPQREPRAGVEEERARHDLEALTFGPDGLVTRLVRVSRADELEVREDRTCPISTQPQAEPDVSSARRHEAGR